MNEYQKLPQIDKILNLKELSHCNKKLLANTARAILDQARYDISKGKSAPDEKEIINKIKASLNQLSPRRLINATGVVLHTNLGRAPISPEVFDDTKALACGYSSLEFDIKTGQRGDRYQSCAKLCASIFKAQDALLVNNNAAAVFLILNTLAKEGEAIISRGELVEIGGSFRIPEVMKQAGVRLCEVGTSNKTHLSDYQNAINDNTKLILKVHKSNFAQLGFTSEVAPSELASLAKKSNLPFYYDLGAGHEGHLPKELTQNEASISQLINSGVELLSFSADKLFGGAQCGVILGTSELIQKLRQNQLLRILRVDKISLSLLYFTLNAYALNPKSLPTLDLLNKSQSELKALANQINTQLIQPLKIVSTKTYAGGGSLPNKTLNSIALALPKHKSLEQISQDFRDKGVIGRAENGRFLLDLRAIMQDDVNGLIRAINEHLQEFACKGEQE